MTPPPAELHDIPDHGPLLPGIEVPLWFWIILVAALLALLSALLYFLLRKRSADAPLPGTTFAEARAALHTLRESAPGRPLAEVATDTSLILRRYLADSLQEPALFETHEEFLVRGDALERLPAGARERLAPLLGTLAEYKYGPSHQDAKAARELVDSAREVLHGLESTRERQVA